MEIKHNSEEYIELEKPDRDKPDRDKTDSAQREKRVSGEKGKNVASKRQYHRNEFKKQRLQRCR